MRLGHLFLTGLLIFGASCSSQPAEGPSASFQVPPGLHGIQLILDKVP